jgi:sugar O-acyltransferase (sialic acid O-acetyltransferase NeuD family)
MEKIAIWGAGGHARVVAEILQLSGQYEIVAFIDTTQPKHADNFYCGLPLLGSENLEVALRSLGIEKGIVAIGDNATRTKLSNLLRQYKLSPVVAIHPSATISPSATIGVGTVIVAGAIINPAASIGENVIINTGATIDHDCHIEDGVHISPGVHLGGKVAIGQETWIGIGSTVRDHIRIGNGSIIGAGSVVVDDIPSRVMAYGIPAKIIREV